MRRRRSGSDCVCLSVYVCLCFSDCLYFHFSQFVGVVFTSLSPFFIFVSSFALLSVFLHVRVFVCLFKRLFFTFSLFYYRYLVYLVRASVSALRPRAYLWPVSMQMFRANSQV